MGRLTAIGLVLLLSAGSLCALPGDCPMPMMSCHDEDAAAQLAKPCCCGPSEATAKAATTIPAAHLVLKAATIAASATVDPAPRPVAPAALPMQLGAPAPDLLSLLSVLLL